jgi:hypothetical protein
MTGEPDENEEILGFADADRAPLCSLSDRLRPRLDSLALKVTRRPRRAFIAAGLMIVALAASAVAYSGPAHRVSHLSASGTAARPQPVATRVIVPGQCPASGRSGLSATEIAKILDQLREQAAQSSSGAQQVETITVESGPGKHACAVLSLLEEQGQISLPFPVATLPGG